MNKMFSQMTRLIFGQSKRLLAILILGFVTISAYASTYYARATVSVNSKDTGKGKVYIKKDDKRYPTSGYSETETTDVLSQDNKNFTFKLGAEILDINYCVTAWNGTDNKTVSVSADNVESSITFIAESESQASPSTVTYSPVFSKRIESSNSMLTINSSSGSSVTTDVTLRRGTSLTASSSDISKFTCEITLKSGDTWALTITATNQAGNGDFATITITSNEGATETVSVNFVANQEIIFVGSPYGTYIVSQGDAFQQLIEETTNLSPLPITDPDNFVLSFSEIKSINPQYRFCRFKCTPENGSPYYIYDDEQDGETQSGLIKVTTIIEPEFVPINYAQFIILGDTANHYSDLNRAIEVAVGKTGKQVVAVSLVGANTVYLAPGNYSIPDKIVLLIPGDNVYSERTNDAIKDDYGSYKTCEGLQKCLRLQDNTSITVENGGAISVYAKLSNETGYNGMPYTYGQIAMGDNTSIVVESGGVLSVFGYITGNRETSSVSIRSGGLVYEVFQIRDWRGGSVVLDMAGVNIVDLVNPLVGTDVYAKGNENDVFPIGQYYIQNIETKLILDGGAIEKLTTGVSMTNPLGGDPIQMTANPAFIVPENEAIYPSGLFRLGSDSKIEKYYDQDNDRLVFLVEGLTEDAKSSMEKITLTFPVLGKYMHVSSNDYVLPLTNNMDIKLKNIDVEFPFDMSLLGDASIEIDQYSTVKIAGKFFVYDKEESRNLWYYSSKNTTIVPVRYTPIKSQYLLDANGNYITSTTVAHVKDNGHSTDSGNLYKRQEDDIATYENDIPMKDATIIVDGRLEVNGNLYTTKSGANITSTGAGRVIFNKVDHTTGDKLFRFIQIAEGNLQAESYPPIAVTNAKLHNDEFLNPTEHYSATDAEAGDEYIYHTQEGKWIKPEIGIPGYDVNTFNITLPNSSVTQMVKGNVVAEGMTIKGWDIELSGDNFAIDDAELAGNEYRFDADESALYIPIKYTPRNIHNNDVNNPYTGSITVTITYDDFIKGPNQTIIQTIPLKAWEDYTPDFAVVIDGDTINDGDTYTMSGFIQMETIKNAIIRPAKDNVTTLVTTNWQKQVTDPFAFNYGVLNNNEIPATLTYEPADLNNPHTATLILTASYTDANTDATKATHSKSVTIYLNATADKQQNNNLAFIAELQDGITLYQGQTKDNIIANNGNGEPLSFEFNDMPTYEEDLVTIAPNTNGNYTLTTKVVDHIVDVRTITVKAIQEGSETMIGKTITFQITVLPSVIWNWSTMYFGNGYDHPVESDNYTLALQDVKDTDGNTVAATNVIDYDPTSKTAVIKSDITGEYVATFLFQDGSYSKTFTSNIYADPRNLPYCVDNTRTYTRVTTIENNATTGVTYNNGQITFASTQIATSSWTIQMNGVADLLSFTPIQTDKAWRIEAYNGNYWDVIFAWDTLTVNVEKTISLQPNTQQIRFTYAAGSGNAGILSNVCVTALSNVKANKPKLYIPIKKDENDAVVTTTQKVTLYYVNNSNLSISFSSNDITADIYTLPANTGVYSEQEVTISNNGTSEDVVNMYVKDINNNTLLTLPIRPFEFRQGLPINSAIDNSERYYFLTTASATDNWADSTTNNVYWDEVHRAIVFQNPNTTTARRSVTLAYEGAADYIQFHTSANVTLSEWVFAESADGVVWNTPQVDTLKTIINEGKGIRRTLNYTTRYVRISYRTLNVSKLQVTNIVLKGTPHLIANPMSMTLNDDTDNNGHIGLLTLTTINLQQIRIVSNSPAIFKIIYDAENLSDQRSEYVATSIDYPSALGTNKVGTIQLGVVWQMINTIDDATLTIYNDSNDSILAVINVLGAKGLLTQGNAQTGLYTGIPDGSRDINGDGVLDSKDKFTYHGKPYNDYQYREVNVTNAFATDGKALFDYLFIFGETTAKEGNDITPPEGSTLIGSNATTPLLVYKKTINQSGEYIAYQFVGTAETNYQDKAIMSDVIVADINGVAYIDVQDSLRVYMTGFCPYATTGYSKTDEGVFLFRGKHGAKLDIYLEDCHVFSRNKTINGNGFYGDKEGGDVSTDGYARGSGGVLVFENVDPQEQLQNYQPFEVNIHTIGDNLLNSNYGCFFGVALNGELAMRATQVSSPIHIHMHKKEHARKTKTTLNFDDLWPTAVDANNAITATKRTNGFLALKKQANNAPSIDMGNKHTEVNFRGGRVELQNSQIGSDTYKTTLAISHRSGFFGSDDAGFQLCYGIGTDSVGGVVNFYDGTVTVRPMKVEAAYRQYYLMDTLPDGAETEYTSCLRLPKNTYVYGGSHCFMRACQHVTSKGGAPTDGASGSPLGQYVYTMQDGVDVLDLNTKLATIVGFPNNVEGLLLYHQNHGYTYGLESVAPDSLNQLYFWIPDGYGGISAEKDKLLSTWKACMTEIAAGIPNVAEGRIGGDTPIELDEEVKYFLYCQLDKNIRDIIRAGEKNADGEVVDYTYLPPFEIPAAAKNLSFFKGKTYARYDLITYVSDSLQYQVVSDTAYAITDRAYYITTATADIWKTFTAPFDVAKIYVVETFSETKLEETPAGEGENKRDKILEEQARHNADFAAFFAVAMAMGTMDDFDAIFDSYREWAKSQDRDSLGLWNGQGDYTLRSMQELVPYYGNNWRDANFYLNHNTGNWNLVQSALTQEMDSFAVQWEMLPDTALNDGILLHKGETYSMMFPYCTACEPSFERRNYWDYWSGKFLIFESTEGEQVINGRDFLNDTIAGNVFTQTPNNGEVIVTGNSTFAQLHTDKEYVYVYDESYPSLNDEYFAPVEKMTTIYPTTAFLYGEVPANAQGMPARKISRSGKIFYDQSQDDDDDNGNQTPTGNIPTVGGGNDLFITSTATGINVAVAQPQQVRVLSSTGAVIFSGMVQTAVDVLLPTAGVYVITGENEVHKILH